MIIFFGPAGAGKSMQGQMLAARMGWRWLSAGQLLRDTKDIEILNAQHQGALVGNEKVNQVIAEALSRSGDVDRVVLDGFPRQLDQAKWLVDNQPKHNRSINLVIILDTSVDVIMQRLKLRGRVDDDPEIIADRFKIYDQEIDPILNYFNEQRIKITHINGDGTVGQVHDRVAEELANRKLI